MKIKNLIKEFVIFSRYLIYRFILARGYRSFYLFPRVLIEPVNSDKETSDFFGYYNITPFNSNNDFLFGTTTSSETRGSMTENLKIKIKSSEGEIFDVGETSSWNWQQGAMVQWIDDTKVIYNKYLGEKDLLGAVILDFKQGKEKVITSTINSISNSGDFALTLNYERLAELRPDYGYFNRQHLDEGLSNADVDGIWKVDIVNNSSKLIITLKALQGFHPVKSMENSVHKVNHIDISPSGRRFMFLHRWVGPEGRFMRLITANCSDGSEKHLVTGNEMVSHSCWKGNDEIVSFCRLADGRNRYVHFKDQDGIMGIIGEEEFKEDGHPSISPNGRWMLTDDYPDLSRFSKLYLYNLITKKKYVVGEFYQPLKFRGEQRIDLHPKWAPDGKQVSIDSGHSGKRKAYILDVEIIVSNEV